MLLISNPCVFFLIIVSSILSSKYLILSTDSSSSIVSLDENFCSNNSFIIDFLRFFNFCSSKSYLFNISLSSDGLFNSFDSKCSLNISFTGNSFLIVISIDSLINPSIILIFF